MEKNKNRIQELSVLGISKTLRKEPAVNKQTTGKDTHLKLGFTDCSCCLDSRECRYRNLYVARWKVSSKLPVLVLHSIYSSQILSLKLQNYVQFTQFSNNLFLVMGPIKVAPSKKRKKIVSLFFSFVGVKRESRSRLEDTYLPPI
jgi:hypothetical protein